MRKFQLMIALLILTGCGSIPRPDLGIEEVGGKEYMMEQPTVAGFKVGKPRPVEVKSEMSQTKETVQEPAKWLLWIMLPLGILTATGCGIAVLLARSVRLARLLGIGSVGAFAASAMCVAWIIATTWMWWSAAIAISIVALIVLVAHKKTEGRSILIPFFQQ